MTAKTVTINAVSPKQRGASGDLKAALRKVDALLAQNNPASRPPSQRDDGEKKNDETGDWMPVNVPRYALPNTASLLPEYANAEAEFIHRAFVASSYDTLHSLPEKLDYGQVMRARFMSMEQGRRGGMEDFRPAMAQRLIDRPFEYSPSPYDSVLMADRQRRDESKRKIAEVSNYDFVAPSTVPQRPKFKSALVGDLTGFQSINVSDPYDAALDDALREKWLKESLTIHPRPQMPSGRVGIIGGPPTQADARSVALTLQTILCEDWEGVEVAIYSNAQGNWVVRFSLDSVESPAGLAVYMNVLLRCNPVVIKLQMSRVVEHWNVLPGDGYLYFSLRPPWVKARPTADTFYVLHPAEKLFASRREEILKSTSVPAAEAARVARLQATLDTEKKEAGGQQAAEEESKPQISMIGQSILEASLKRQGGQPGAGGVAKGASAGT